MQRRVPSELVGLATLSAVSVLYIVLVTSLYIKHRAIGTAFIYSTGFFSDDGSSFNITTLHTKGAEEIGKRTHDLSQIDDIFKNGPFKFMQTYKNPCWNETISNLPIRCLPYFFVIGTTKAGTTDVYDKLVQHPQIYRGVKETHWLMTQRFRKDVPGIGKLSYFINTYFINAVKHIHTTAGEDGFHKIIFGEYTPSSIYYNDNAMKGPGQTMHYEPPYTNADVIYHLNPNTKLIAVIRNPIDRLYSEYLYFDENKPHSASLFHTYVVKTTDYLNTCLHNNTLRHCVYTPPPLVGAKVRPRIGIYDVHLKEFMRVFPTQQLLVIKLENYSKNPLKYVTKMFEFLEIDQLPSKHVEAIIHSRTGNSNSNTYFTRVGPMLNETRQLLYEFYKPHNERLVELLGEEFDYNVDQA